MQPCCSGHQGTWDKNVCFIWETLDSVQPRTHCELLKVIAIEAEKLLLNWTPPPTCPFFLSKNAQCVWDMVAGHAFKREDKELKRILDLMTFTFVSKLFATAMVMPLVRFIFPSLTGYDKVGEKMITS